MRLAASPLSEDGIREERSAASTFLLIETWIMAIAKEAVFLSKIRSLVLTFLLRSGRCYEVKICTILLL